MATIPVDPIFSDYRRAVLALLLPRPEDALHLRDIARLTGNPAGTLHRELKVLADAGLLWREPQGNQACHRANRACSIYPELTAILLKTTGLVEVLAARAQTSRRRCRHRLRLRIAGGGHGDGGE